MYPKRSVDQRVVLKDPFPEEIKTFTISMWLQIGPLSQSPGFISYKLKGDPYDEIGIMFYKDTRKLEISSKSSVRYSLVHYKLSTGLPISHLKIYTLITKRRVELVKNKT